MTPAADGLAADVRIDYFRSGSGMAIRMTHVPLGMVVESPTLTAAECAEFRVRTLDQWRRRFTVRCGRYIGSGRFCTGSQSHRPGRCEQATP